VVRSNKNISVQVVDDQRGATLFALSTFGKNAPQGAGRNREGARVLGEAIGQKLKAQSLESCVFDRNGLPYHGVVKEVAEGIRKEGIRV
jgi:large subunit ribosomal protein L18